MKKNWWKEGIVYQIYPRSFKDSNGDGIGDLRGIIDRLDYLHDLGITIIWLCPVYPSPNDDNGYDVSDYQGISPEFGTMEEFDELLDGLHSRGMKLIMDLVVNHSSDEHAWFQESKKSKDNPYRDYYIWRKGVNGGPPNNWISYFGGSAWEYDETSDEYYLHLFSKKQPDLNWENEKVRREIYEMMHFWFRKGIDGFRMDVIPFISKIQTFPDIDPNDFHTSVETIYANGPRLHEFLQEMHREVLSQYDVMTVGEAVGVPPEKALLYVGEDRNELSMIFHFGHLLMHSGPKGRFDTLYPDLPEFKEIFQTWENATKDGAWLAIFLGNHDFARIVSRFGNDQEYRVESAKLLALMLLSMKGTPYIYQGDEIAMKNTIFSTYEDLRDIEAVNYFQESRSHDIEEKDILDKINIHGRDHARTPVQWSAEKYAGFGETEPWIKVNEDYEDINVEAQQKDPGSVLNFYRKMIQFRKENSQLVYGETEFMDMEHPHLFAYQRKGERDCYLIVLNFTSEEHNNPYADPDLWDLQISNYSKVGTLGLLRPWEGQVFKRL